MSPPNTKINTITSTASIVPLTMLDVIRSGPAGFCSNRSYVPGIEIGLLMAPDLNWSTSILHLIYLIVLVFQGLFLIYYEHRQF